MNKKRPHYRTNIHLNVWRDPMPVLKSEDYLSPHCQSENCSWCKERRRRKRAVATAALEALQAPSMFWDTKLGGHQEQLGPSAPDRWLTTFVKEPGGPGDVMGYWPRREHGR